MAKFVCRQCNKDFISYSLKKNKFCSLPCYWQSMKVIRTCKTCGEQFHIKGTKRTYCSKECQKAGEWGKKVGKWNFGKSSWNKGLPNTWSNGEKSNFWRGGIAEFTRKERSNFMNTLPYVSWRRGVFERDDYQCQICGCNGGYLVANHIKRYIDYPELRVDVSNGITICRDCDNRWVKTHEEEWESYFNFNLENRGIKLQA